MSEFIAPLSTPVLMLKCEEAFMALTDKEKLYAHYLSKATCIGSLICIAQVSPESPLVFTLLHKLFKLESVEDLKKRVHKGGIATQEEMDSFVMYTAAVFYNYGNYKDFGDTKIIPDLPKDTFEKILGASSFAEKDPDHLQSVLSRCLDVIFSLKDIELRLGFPEKGTTTYLSKNFLEKDNEVITQFFKEQGMMAFNTRLFKTVDSNGYICYEVRLASVLETGDDEANELVSSSNFCDRKFNITRGDYSKVLKLVNKNLLLAMEFAANDNQKQMIEQNIRSFHTGSIEAHREATRFWIRDQSPTVESLMGFIETYKDPCGVRGAFESAVLILNKTMSKKFDTLVKSATEFLPLLPWPDSYEKDTFLKPDFTSVDYLARAGGMPFGCCLPNYADIKQSEGFKNLSFGNAIYAFAPDDKVQFVNDTDQEYLHKYGANAFELQVGLHELLGHGSGKLFYKNKDGSFNFDVATVTNYETNAKISSWYEPGETGTSLFGSFYNPMEECRAESVGLFLCSVPEVLKVFGHEENSDIFYTNWLDTVLKGLNALEMYDPKTESWLQAHSQARFVILQVCLEAGEGFVEIKTITGSDGKPDLLFTLDRTKIESVGKKAVGNLLRKTQLYKSTADKASCLEMFNRYSAVNSEDSIYPFLEFRKIVLARKKPRRIFIQANSTCKELYVGSSGSCTTVFHTIELFNCFQFEECNLIHGR